MSGTNPHRTSFRSRDSAPSLDRLFAEALSSLAWRIPSRTDWDTSRSSPRGCCRGVSERPIWCSSVSRRSCATRSGTAFGSALGAGSRSRSSHKVISEPCVGVLGHRLIPTEQRAWAATLRAFTVPHPEDVPVGLAVTPHDSEHDGGSGWPGLRESAALRALQRAEAGIASGVRGSQVRVFAIRQSIGHEMLDRSRISLWMPGFSASGASL